MMPIGDDDTQRRHVPIVTYALVAINVLVFFVELAQPDPDAFIMKWGAIPREIMASQNLITLVTSMFLHAGWAHLIGNMVFLWIFGDNVEDAFGPLLYTIFYFSCGIAASLAQVLVSPGSGIPGVGASGAISGVLAGYILMFGANRVRVLVGGAVTTVPAYYMIGLWIVLQFISGLASITSASTESGGIAYAAHVGGFLAGLVLTFVLRGFRRPQITGPSGTGAGRWLPR